MEKHATISGPVFRNMLISAANAINSQKHFVNELNVFPVPDGDTGTNMSMTMSAAVRELEKASPASTVGQISETAASALLRGARGNSGVILSLLFRGVARSLSGKETAGGEDIIAALLSGVEAAYKAVMKPAEGTILTVARESATACVKLKGQDREDCATVLQTALSQAEITLEKTPDMLPVLKKAGVVDAGGKGYVVILSAMFQALIGKGVVAKEPGSAQPETTGGAAGEVEEDIHFTYCTEFIINKIPGSTEDPAALRAYLETIGDCVLVADDKTFIKVHVHTNNPDKVLGEALKSGSLTDIKIDNMRVQHEEKAAAAAAKVEITKPLGFVAVAAGKGVADLFRDLGTDQVVEGGQTMNPSTEDILSAIESTAAESVIVLPNNKNIILAAEQAVALSDRKVYVLHTKTIPQGITAMVNYDPETDINTNLLNMDAASEKVHTGLITFAARDSDFDGRKIKKDEILALANGKLNFTESDPVRAAVRLTKNLSDKSTSYITLIYGESVTEEEAESARSQIAEKIGSQAEVTLISGGQPVYHFIISVE